MHDAHAFLAALAVVLCVAAFTTVVFQWLKQPVILGYLIAGLVIGPHVPIPLVADPGIVHTLSELGVILLMFSIGLEFSLANLVRVGPTAGLTAVLETSLMVWLGFVVGQLFGWTTRESVFTGAIIAISSTTIIVKAFGEQRVRGPLREFVLGVLIVEDLVAILLMTVLTAVSSGAGLSAGDLLVTVGRLAAFLVGLVSVGLLVIPRLVRAIVKLQRTETTLIAAIGICFGIALLAQSFGYSVALGAFLAGSLVAESGEGRAIEHLITPIRDMFAAIFFVSVGMLIDPALIAEYWRAIVVLAVVVVAGKIVGVSLGAFLTGRSTRMAVQSGMSLAQIGEFSFIIAGLGLTLGATRPFLYPIAIAVSALTTYTTPWLIRLSGPTANAIDRRLPKPIQTFTTLYASWLERMHASPGAASAGLALRRAIRLLIVDAVLLVAVVVGISLATDPAVAALEERFHLKASLARLAIGASAAALAAPFCLGIYRLVRWIGRELAERALPPTAAGLDLADAPRRTLTLALQLATLLVLGLPLVAILEPFVPGLAAAGVLLVLLAAVGFGFWRRASDLQGHVRAGAEAIVEALATHARAKAPAEHGEDALHSIHTLLPGIGEPVAVRLAPSSPAVGRTLAQLDLRGATGATVLAIRRGSGSVLVPGAREVLQSDDVLALAGSHEAIDAARALLAGEAATT